MWKDEQVSTVDGLGDVDGGEMKEWLAQVEAASIINAQHKKSGKMQWTREGAHKVLQIRGKIASNEWGDRWQEPVLSALGVIA